jgi:hypothetical protein
MAKQTPTFGGPTEKDTPPVVVTDPRGAEVHLADAYDASQWAEDARDQVHGILSALNLALDNDKVEDPRPFIKAALTLLKAPLATIELGTSEVRTSLGSLNECLSQPLHFIDEPDAWDVEVAKPWW